MNALLQQVDTQTVRTLVITLLHTLWQAPLIAALLYAVLRLLPAARASARYALCTTALAGVVLTAAVTFGLLNYTPAPPPPERGAVAVHRSTVESPAAVSPATTPAPPHATAAPPAEPGTDWTTALAVTWATGVLVMLARVGVAVAGVRQVRRRAQPLEHLATLGLIDRLRNRLGLRRAVRVMTHDALASPAIIGVFKPVLLLPASMLTQTPIAHLEAIVAHELAHIRRWDFLVNLGQMLLEALLFFNPAVWWVSRQMRIEREACCDAVAIATTGQAVGYAEALTTWLERMRDDALVLPAVAPALADKAAPGDAVDRVRRILRPGDRPAVRLSWPMLIVVLLVGTILLAAVWRGTGMAVALAADILTPEQRIQQIHEAQQQFGPKAIAHSDRKEDRVTLRGTITTIGGRPLPDQGYLTVRSETPNQTSSRSDVWTGGKFDVHATPGIIWIGVDVEGFAPAVIGPLTGEPGSELEDLQVTLDVGFPAEVHVKDDAGQPVANSKVSVSPDTKGGGFVHAFETDDRGVLRIPHASPDFGYRLSIAAPGVQKTDLQPTKLSPTEPLAWVVKRSKPTTLTFTGTDDRPVADAVVRNFAEERPGQTMLNAWHGAELGKTDRAGRIVLDTLADGTKYILLLEAADGRRQLVHGVRPGDADRAVRLDPELTVSGTITGDLSKLRSENGRPVVSVGQTVSITNSSHGGGRGTAPVEIRDGRGHFVVRHLLPGSVAITAGETSKQLKIDKPIDGVVIDLAAVEALAPATRHVELVVKTPPGQPQAQGKVKWQSYPPTGSGRASIAALDGLTDLIDGRARVRAYVDGRLNLEPDRVVGYWFPEKGVDAIPAGEGLHVVETDAFPAGAVVGMAYDADGQPLDQRRPISLYVVDKPGLPEGVRFDTRHNIRAAEGRFMITPVPLGGRYAASISDGHNHTFSEPFTLDAAKPTHKVELRLTKGVDVTVIVRDADGKAVSGVAVDCRYSSPYSSHSVSPAPATDDNGHATVKNLNPNAPGNGYVATIDTERDYVTTSAPIRLDGQPTVITLQRGGVVSGRLTDLKTGWPIPGAQVQAMPLDWKPGETHTYKPEGVTDAQGRFRFSNLPTDREFGFNVEQAKSSTYPSPHRAAPGAGKALDIAIELPDWSELRPVKPE